MAFNRSHVYFDAYKSHSLLCHNPMVEKTKFLQIVQTNAEFLLIYQTECETCLTNYKQFKMRVCIRIFNGCWTALPVFAPHSKKVGKVEAWYRTIFWFFFWFFFSFHKVCVYTYDGFKILTIICSLNPPLHFAVTKIDFSRE